jgi:curved DNA-binding protein
MKGPSSIMTAGQARELLGLPPGADEQTISRAYHAAVKSVHPDREGGDAERLRQVIEAYQLLSAIGAPRLTFTLAPRPPEARPPRRIALPVSVEEALFGGEREIQTPEGRRLKANLPAGLRNGECVRLAAADDGADLLLQISIACDPGVTVRGADILIQAEIDAEQLSGGACVELDTPRGRRVFLSPSAAEDGGVVVVRFKGQGLPARGEQPAGDMILSLTSRQSRGLFRRFVQRRAA